MTHVGLIFSSTMTEISINGQSVNAFVQRMLEDHQSEGDGFVELFQRNVEALSKEDVTANVDMEHFLPKCTTPKAHLIREFSRFKKQYL